MPDASPVVFETKRLAVRRASVADLEFYLCLWSNPRVMANVGFPTGLPVTPEQLTERLTRPHGSPLNRLLVVELKDSGEPIGECKLGRPNADGVCTTDVKLLPQFWGHAYGREIKHGLLDYLFTHTSCTAVEASPNVANTASIKMQESAGGVRVGEGVHEFPESMRAYTTPVHYLVYRVSRERWQERRAASRSNSSE